MLRGTSSHVGDDRPSMLTKPLRTRQVHPGSNPGRSSKPSDTNESIIMRKLVAAIFLGALLITACSSDAQRASSNISTAADQFEVQRHIIGVNGITDEVSFEVEGRCSVERRSHDLLVICKHGDDDFRRHHLGVSDNLFYVVTQQEGIDADEYRTRIVLKPENIVPNFDLVTRGQAE